MRDSDLHAYVDGQLDPARRIEVETWLAEDEEAARRVDAYRAQNAALHSLFDPVLNEPLEPGLADLADQLRARLDAGERRRWWRQPAWQRLAASVAFVVAGLGAGWLGHRQVAPPTVAERPSAPTFAEEAAQAHTFYANSRFEVEMGADNQEALDSWLSERLGRTVFGPDLTSAGYRLKGGRSLPTDDGAVAQYMYETGDGNRLTLFVGFARQAPQSAISFIKRDAIATFYWTEGPLSYALVGRLERDQLVTIAQLVHHKLKGPPPRPQTVPPQVQPSPEPPAVTPPQEPSVAPPGSLDQGRPKAS